MLQNHAYKTKTIAYALRQNARPVPWMHNQLHDGDMRVILLRPVLCDLEQIRGESFPATLGADSDDVYVETILHCENDRGERTCRSNVHLF